jgi:3-deoxy-manno-octulosonate cytidylyltransferase (CMP-KDO synthetase)
MNQDFTVILAIPARFDSSRLPRKLVAEIGGKPMLGHVLERCLQSTAAHATVLCTDSQELAEQACRVEGFFAPEQRRLHIWE